jgi:hypothetical protein
MKSLSDARQLSIPIACRKFRFLIRDWISAGHQNIGISKKTTRLFGHSGGAGINLPRVLFLLVADHDEIGRLTKKCV